MDYQAHTRKFVLSVSGLFLALAILTLGQFWTSAGTESILSRSGNSRSSGLDQLAAAAVFSREDFYTGVDLTANAWSAYANFTAAMAGSLSENIFVKPIGLFLDWWKNLWAAMISNWRAYLGNDTSDQPVAESAVSAVDREQLKAEIKAELEKELGRVKSAAPASAVPADRYAVPSNGVVVVPSSGNAAADAKTKEGISSMFSDPVKVQFDPSGRAGVITPIFKRNVSKDYLFLLTPVQK